jgi:ParB family chromosome partitioning protein
MSDYQQIAISEVVVPEHRRQTDPEKVQALAQSIGDIGLQHPIGVTCERKLIHGRHRLEALRLLGCEQIPALIHDMDDLHAELAEIDENIQRSQLSPLDEFNALRRRKQIYEELHPETRQHKAGGHAKHGSTSDRMSFAEDTARKTGKSRRTIERSVAIARKLPDDIQESIRDTAIAKNKSQLEELARLPAEQQRRVADKLASGEADTVEQAFHNAISQQNDDNRPLNPSQQPRCPNCGHTEFDPEDGACLQCYEPDVVPPHLTDMESAEEVTEEKCSEGAGWERSLDGGLKFEESYSLDQFVEALERDILKQTNAWHRGHPECSWRLIADRIEMMVNRICKNLRS